MELNRAFDSTLAIMTNVQPSQLSAPTPCASWDVGLDPRSAGYRYFGAWWFGVSSAG